MFSYLFAFSYQFRMDVIMIDEYGMMSRREWVTRSLSAETTGDTVSLKLFLEVCTARSLKGSESKRKIDDFKRPR